MRATRHRDRLPVAHTSPQGQPPLARRRARVALGGVGRKVRVNFLPCCCCCQAPRIHFSHSHETKTPLYRSGRKKSLDPQRPTNNGSPKVVGSVGALTRMHVSFWAGSSQKPKIC